MATNPVGPAANEVVRLRDNRWLILFFSILSMVAVANFQYGWTLFVPPLQKHLGVDQATIQVTFTVFVCSKHGWCPSKAGSSTASDRSFS